MSRTLRLRTCRTLTALVAFTLGATARDASIAATLAPGTHHSSVERLPTIVHRLPPVYPDSLRRAGVGGMVVLRVRLTETGAVSEVRPMQGPDPLSALAMTAVRQWTFTPHATDGVTESTWVQVPLRFDPTDPAKVAGSTRPGPIVRVPLSPWPDGYDANGPPYLGRLQFRVAADGTVREAHFVGDAPAESNAVFERARRWVWQPAQDAFGAPIESWSMVHVKARPDVELLDRPDTTLGGLLMAAESAFVSAEETRAGAGRPDRSGAPSPWLRREVDPLIFAHVVANWLSDSTAYAGPHPWQSRCAPHFDANVSFEGPGGKVRVDLARGCDWMQVVSATRVLFVPYRPIKAKIEAEFARLFPTTSSAAVK